MFVLWIVFLKLILHSNLCGFATTDIPRHQIKIEHTVLVLTWTLGCHLLWLFGRSEEDGLTGGAAASHADALHVDDVLGVLVQIPQRTGARGGVHFLDEPQHAHVLLLQTSEEQKSRGQEARCNMILYWSLQGNSHFFGSTSAEVSPVRVKLVHQPTVWYFVGTD